MAYNYDDQIPTWQNEGTEPADSVKTEGYKAGYKPPAAYFNWFWSRVLRWIGDLRTKLSSLHTQVEQVQSKVSALESKNYDVSASDVLSKLKSVDGTGSGLDADTLDGKDSSDFADVNHKHAEYAATTHNHAVATTNSNGFMSAEDKEKLDGIDLENMSTYEHPSTHPATMITGLAEVAKSGNYADLVNKPILSAVATSNDYNDLNNKPAAYTHPATHPASMIEETTNIKMMTAAERSKLAGIASGANNYTHPSTHPATMITGLENYMTSLGYGKVASGSYIGDGDKSDNDAITTYNGRAIEFPFTPQAVLIADNNGNSIMLAQGKTFSYSSGSTTVKTAMLTGDILYVKNNNKVTIFSFNLAGYTYAWLAW